jgi:dual specificity phosphatase 12
MTQSTDIRKECTGSVRVLVIGSHKARVAKVASLLHTTERIHHNNIHIEYVPCVATFDSYQNEAGEKVRYLASIDYYGRQGTDPSPQSLLPFFDTIISSIDANKKGLHFEGISGAAIGIGIETMEDTKMIQKFLAALSQLPVKIDVLQPNPEFATMAEELEAFREMSPEEKAAATESQSIGPGKMAKFTHELAKSIIDEEMERLRQIEQAAIPSVPLESTIVETIATIAPMEYDPSIDRYACRTCRTVLFGQMDVEDPPHTQAQHTFSTRKHNARVGQCHSYFLKTTLSWMGPVSDTEGKSSCPKCDTKVGHWNWSGAQCSCGTWVVPAIQIPKSKVDVLAPSSVHSSSLGVVISPMVLHMQNLSVQMRE